MLGPSFCSKHTNFLRKFRSGNFFYFYGLLIYFSKLINAYKLSCAVYTFMSASGSYTFPHMLPEVTPERCTFYNGAEAG